MVARTPERWRRRVVLIVVTDPATRDGTKATAQRCIDQHNLAGQVVVGRRAGLAACWNEGVALADSDYIVRWDAHGVYPDQLIERYFSCYIDGDGLDDRTVVGGPVLLVAGATTARARALARVDGSIIFSGGAGDAKRRTTRTEAFSTEFVARYLCNPKVYAQVGEYTELPFACEDTEWAARARQRGVTFLNDPRLESAHQARTTLLGFFRQKYRNGAANSSMLLGQGLQTGRRKAIVTLAVPLVAGLATALSPRSAVRMGGLYLVGTAVLAAREPGLTPGERLSFVAGCFLGHSGFGLGIARGVAAALAGTRGDQAGA